MKKENAKKSLVPVGIMLLTVILFVMVILDMPGGTLKQATKSFVAMGTVITEKLYGETDSETDFEIIENTITQLENEISMRIDSSTVGLLNKNSTVTLSNELKETFDLCKEVYEKSNGAFDITMGKVTSLWKIGEEGAAVPSENELDLALSSVDGSKVKTENDTISIENGQKVDLGAVGKGLACDRIRKALDGTDVDSAIISVGGSVLLYGENPLSDTWSVAIRDPRGESSEQVGKLSLTGGTVSTSGDYERVLEVGDKKYHHILDPKTGYPADSGLMSVTVVCDNGLLSDALSTAAFIMGKDEGAKLLASFGAEGVFIDNERNVFVTDGLLDKFTLTNDSYSVQGKTE